MAGQAVPRKNGMTMQAQVHIDSMHVRCSHSWTHTQRDAGQNADSPPGAWKDVSGITGVERSQEKVRHVTEGPQRLFATHAQAVRLFTTK